jgi:hypothetical protein
MGGHGLQRRVAEAVSGVVRVNVLILHLDNVFLAVANGADV